MSMFDTKISQGNSGILRSRDMYHLMERLDSVTGFLLFQGTILPFFFYKILFSQNLTNFFFAGVSGHFTTISLMMWSMKLYVMCIFLVTLSGASLKSFGNITYATEWLFHAGLTTIIPLVVEFLVRYEKTIFFRFVNFYLFVFCRLSTGLLSVYSERLFSFQRPPWFTSSKCKPNTTLFFEEFSPEKHVRNSQHPPHEHFFSAVLFFYLVF